MPTETRKSALAELRKLERVRDERHEAARAAHALIEAHEAARRAQGLVALATPPDLEAKWAAARERFADADLEVRRFKVAHARELLSERVPGRDASADAIVAAVHQLRQAVAGYTATESSLLVALTELGLDGVDMRSDARVSALARALDPFEGLDHIDPPYSRSAETPDGHLPLFRPNDDADGWVR